MKDFEDALRLLWFSTSFLSFVFLAIAVGCFFGAEWGWLLASVGSLIVSIAMRKELENERRSGNRPG